MLLRFWLMNASQAAALNTTGTDAEQQLEPREIDMGVHTGKFVLPYRVIQNEAFRDLWDAILMCEDVTLETDDIFLPPPDEGRAA